MRYIGTAREDEAVAWAKARLGVEHPTSFCRAVSAVDEADNQFALVVLFTNFTETSADVHVAARPGAAWATPRAAREMFSGVCNFAFLHFKLRRLTGLVRSRNRAAIQFATHTGFKLEGIMRHAFADDDLCIYGLLRDGFRSHRWADRRN